MADINAQSFVNTQPLQQSGQMPPETPELFLESEMTRTRDYYVGQHKRLVQLAKSGKMSADDYKANLAQLQDASNKAALEFQQKMKMTQGITQMSALGLLNEDDATRTAWASILPPEAGRTLLAREDEDDAMTPEQMSAYYESVGYAGPGRGETEKKREKMSWKEKLWFAHPVTAPVGGYLVWKHGRVKRNTKKQLTKDYMRWRDGIGYETFSPQKKRQVDLLWDQWMEDQQHPTYSAKGEEIFKGTKAYSAWDPEDPEIRSMRGGKLAKAYGGNRVNQTPILSTDRTNPLQASIAGAMKPKTPQADKVMVISPDGRRGLIPAAQLQDALAAGYKESK